MCTNSLTDDSMRGMYSKERITEVMRLANLHATARVRRYAKSVGRASNETREGIDKRVAKTEAELRTYLESVL